MRWRVALFVVLAMLAAFGIGAIVASRQHPFSPSVVGPTGPGPVPTSTVPTPSGTRWRGRMLSKTSQAYREGTCTSNWRSSLDLVEYSDGTVSGNGRANLSGKAQCFFANAQVQTRAFAFQVRGRMNGSRMLITLYDFEASPTPSFDQGGFYLTVAAADPTISVTVLGDTGKANARLTQTVNALLSRSLNRIVVHARG